MKKTGTVIELSGEEWQLYMEGAFCRTEGRTGVPGAGIAGWFACGLFVAKYQSGDEAWNEDDLERFFKQHKSDYAWELPHYRGAVIHCKDRKTASAIKKQLKKNRYPSGKIYYIH